MTGKDLKKMIISDGLTVAEVARRLGTSQQNLTCALGKDDIKTGLLERVAEAMGKPLAFFYGETFGSAPASMNTHIDATPNCTTSDASVIDLLKIKDEQLLLAMKQTSKAQEQMDKVLEVLTHPTQHPVVAVKESTPIYIAKEGKMEPLTAPLRRRTATNIQGMVSAANTEVARVKALRDKKIDG